MRRLLTFILAALFTYNGTSQQINPVPDYIFRNQMSVGRNAATDSMAYFSVGPKYGANKGIMPPMVVDTALVTGAAKRNGLLIFSIQKNRFLYWDSVRVRWSDMAGSSGAYITGEGTPNYLPKFGTSNTLTNSAMYDSLGLLRVYSNNIGNIQNVSTDTPRAKVQITKDGRFGWGLLIQQNDSLPTNSQLVAILRKGLLTSDKPRPGFGVGLEGQLQDDAGAWKRAGFHTYNIVDSTAANFSAEQQFWVYTGGATRRVLFVRPDSTIRVLRLAGSGTRNVVADANGDLRVGSGSEGLDTLLVSTRAWRQKGDDSVASLPRVTSVSAGTGMSFTTITTTGSVSADTVALATRAWRQKGIDSVANVRVGGSGTTNYVPKFTASGTIGNSQIFDNGTSVGIGTTSPPSTYRFMVSGKQRIENNTNGVNDALDIVNTDAGSSNFITMRFLNGTGTGQILYTGANNTSYGFANTLGLYQVSSNPIQFITNNIARATITGAGRLLVGTTTEGTNTVDIAGTLRSTQGANFATTSGSVGIGTTSPSSLLHVNGNGRFTDASGGIILGPYLSIPGFGGMYSTQVTPDGSNFSMLVSGTNTYLSAPNGFIRFDNAGVERMRLSSAGQLGIGTTSPSEALHVVGRGRFTTIDSSASPINMLWADVNGVIRKAPVASGGLTGSGTTNFIPKFTGSTAVGNSILKDSANNVDVNGTLTLKSGSFNMGISNFTPSGGFASNIFIGGGGTSSTGGGTFNGSINAAMGLASLLNNTTGYANAALGFYSLYENTTGYENMAIGAFSLEDNTTGHNNAAIGTSSLSKNTTGYGNVAIGSTSGVNTNSGGNLTTTDSSVFIGPDSRGSANGNRNEIVIGSRSRGNGSNTTTIGNSSTTTTYLLGKLDIGTIDSTASAINMLYADANGVVKKTAVPAASTDSVKMRTASITAGSGFTLAKEAATGTTIDQVVGFVDASGLTTVKLNGAVYKTTATFSTGSWVTIATIAEYRPNNDVYFSLPNLVSGESFESTGNVDFTAAAAYSGATSLRVRTNGDIQAYVGAVDASADLSGANYVILPIVVSYPILTLTN